MDILFCFTMVSYHAKLSNFFVRYFFRCDTEILNKLMNLVEESGDVVIRVEND